MNINYSKKNKNVQHTTGITITFSLYCLKIRFVLWSMEQTIQYPPPPSLLHKSQLYWKCSNQLHYSLCNKIRISFRGKLCVWNVVISCTVLCLIAAFSKNLLLFYLLFYLKSLSDYNHVCNLLDSLGCQIYRRANIGHFLVFPDYFILSFFLVDILHKIWSFLTHFFYVYCQYHLQIRPSTQGDQETSNFSLVGIIA